MGWKKYRGPRKQLERIREREASIGISKKDMAGRWLADQEERVKAPRHR